MEKNKKNNKSILLILFIMILIGTIGYGAYSYYWTEGTITLDTDYVITDSFGVSLTEKYYEYGSLYENTIADFMSGNYEARFQCNREDGNYVCTSIMELYNRGSLDVVVSIEDLNVIAESNGDELTIDSVTTNWENGSNELAPENYATYVITAVIPIPGHTDELQVLEAPVENMSVDVVANYSLKIEQVH